MTMQRCDFCSSADVRWVFPARSFVFERDFLVIGINENRISDVEALNFKGGYDGKWAACPACHALIVRGDRDKLARRSAKRMLKMPGAPPMSLGNAIDLIRGLQDEFWSRREGPPTRYQR